MAANTLSVYIKSPLFEEVKAAHDDETNPFDYRKVCAEALESALHPEQVLPKNGVGIDMAEVARLAAEVPIDDTVYEFEIKFCNSLTEANSYLELVVDTGGQPVSMCVDPVGRIGFLLAVPKVPVPS